MKKITDHYQKACQVMPGGINSSVRLNKALGYPFYAAKASGSRIFDIAGREFIDMCCAHGAGLLGHAHPAIDEALKTAMKIGYANCFETEYHEELARKLCKSIPCAEKIRFCSSGSEATLHLIRACRAFTGKKKIIRFEGHFHGYHEMIYIGGHPPQDSVLKNREKPYIESPGIPEEFADFIISIPYNNKEVLADTIKKHGHETALVILEPVNYNSACTKPKDGFLKYLRQITKENKILLFFDEIQSSFKKSLGGAQEDFGITPDVCTIGKSLGGGLPLSAFCGKAEIMDIYQPAGAVQHSGTFNAHIIPVLAGLAFVNEALKPDFYPKLQSLEDQFHAGMDKIIKEHDLNMIVPHHGARFNVVLGRKEPVEKYEETFCHEKARWLKIIKRCCDNGVYFHDYSGSPVHHGYSIQHMKEDIDEVLNVFEDALVKVLAT